MKNYWNIIMKLKYKIAVQIHYYYNGEAILNPEHKFLTKRTKAMMRQYHGKCRSHRKFEHVQNFYGWSQCRGDRGRGTILSVSMQGLIDKYFTEMTTKLNVGQIHVMSWRYPHLISILIYSMLKAFVKPYSISQFSE